MCGSVKAVLFDKDGTLVDFHATWGAVYARAADEIVRRFGDGRVSPSALLAECGMGADGRVSARSTLGCGTTPEIAAQMVNVLGARDVEQVTGALEARFLAEAGEAPVGVAGLSQALDDLAAAQLVLGVATMDSEASAQRNLDVLGVTSRFSFVCGYDSGFGHKPGPGMAQAFAADRAIDLRSMVMVGDSPHDLHMGRNAGVGLVVGVLTGAGSRADLSPLADHVLDSIASLPALIA